jgi:periplasmic protein TonB
MQATPFAAFIGANRPDRRGRRRRGSLLLLSVGGHLGLLVLAGALGFRPAPAAAPRNEPLLIRMSAPAGKARSRPASPKPAARKPRSTTQPLEVPPVQPIEPATPPPEVVDEADAHDEGSEEPGEPATEPEGVPDGRRGGIPGGAPDVAFELRDVARPPSVISRVTPVYPREARRSRIEGTVVLRVIVGLDGLVERRQTRVVSSILALDAAAIAAIESWRFSPAIGHSGHPVRVIIEVPFQFFLR